MLVTSSNMKLASVFFVVFGLCLANAIGDEPKPGDEPKSSAGATGEGAPPAVREPETKNLTSNTNSPVAVKPGSDESEKTISTENTSSHSPVTPSTSPITVTPLTSSAAPVPVSPTPDSKVGDWKVVDKAANRTCIRIKGELQVELTLRNQTEYNVSTYSVPPHINATGNCSVLSPVQKITFELDTAKQYYLTLSFGKNGSSKDYYLKEIEGRIPFEIKSEGHVEEDVEEIHYNEKHVFITPINQSYICKDEVKVALNNSKTSKQVVDSKLNKTSVFKTVNIQLEAFKTSPGDTFDPAISCSAPEHTPDIVPIIVGCALAVLVIAVLVAYLVSRRRSQARGYLSM